MRRPEQPPNISAALREHSEDIRAIIENLDSPYLHASRHLDRAYQPWTKTRYYARAHGLNPEVLWAMVKMRRLDSYRYLPLQGDRSQLLRFTTPDVILRELMLIDRQLAGPVLAADDQPLSVSHRERFIISALQEEAVASSMLEGAATTRRDAKAMLASGRKPRTRGERMVFNNYQAISYIREHRRLLLTPDFLLHIQKIVTDGTLEDSDQSGRLRTDRDNIEVVDQYGTVLHTPPPASELPARLQLLCDFANVPASDLGGDFVHPVVRACVLHFQLGFDHPFCDGNGRTARAIFYWYMLRAGYWLFEYLPISRLIYAGPSKYALAFMYTESDDFDVTYFLVYKARIIGRARRELAEHIARQQREVAAGRRVFESDPRLNHRQRDVILRMLRSPHLGLTIQEHQGRHNIAYGTAHSDLINLSKWQYLTKRVIGNKRFEFVRGSKITAAE